MVWFSLVCVSFLSYFVRSVRESASQSLEILNGLIMCSHQLGFLQADPETEFLVQDDLGNHYLWRGGRWSRAASISSWLLWRAVGKRAWMYVHGYHRPGGFEVSHGAGLGIEVFSPMHMGHQPWHLFQGRSGRANGEISAVQIKTDCERALQAPLWGQEPGAVPGESVSWTTPCLHIPTALTPAPCSFCKKSYFRKIAVVSKWGFSVCGSDEATRVT